MDTDRVALVTGANKGIGFAVVRQLAGLSHRVLLGSRDLRRGDDAAAALRGDALDVEALAIDVTDDASVSDAAARIAERYGRLDVLVNNAAVKFEHHPCPPSGTPLDVMRATYETNVFGTVRVIQAMLPLLLRSDAGRVVNVTSSLGSLALASRAGSVFADRPLLGYSTAKTALNAITVQFASELRGTSVKINAADPGYVATDMTNFDGERTPDEGAAVIVRLATVDDDGPTGGFFDDRGPVPW